MIMELNIGDRVRGVNEGDETYTGTVAEIIDSNKIKINKDNGYKGWYVERKDDGNWGANDKNGILTLISNNNLKSKIMNLKEKFVLALTEEPQKSFRKAGITDGDDILTEEGTRVFVSWLLHKKYADEFKTEVVEGMLEEKEEEEK